jgi:predicted CoA-binding protein
LQAGQPAFYVPEYLHSKGIKVIPMYALTLSESCKQDGLANYLDTLNMLF